LAISRTLYCAIISSARVANTASSGTLSPSQSLSSRATVRGICSSSTGLSTARNSMVPMGARKVTRMNRNSGSTRATAITF
jgi:hypothetical protein